MSFYYEEVWQKTVVVVEQEKEPVKPFLYLPDGTPLAKPQPRAGFNPTPAETKKGPR